MSSSPTRGPSGHGYVHNGSVVKSCHCANYWINLPPWSQHTWTVIRWHLWSLEVTADVLQQQEGHVLLVIQHHHQHWKVMLFSHPPFPFRCEEQQILLGVRRLVSFHKWSDCQEKSQAICSKVCMILTNAHWEHGCQHLLILQRPSTAVR